MLCLVIFVKCTSNNQISLFGLVTQRPCNAVILIIEPSAANQIGVVNRIMIKISVNASVQNTVLSKIKIVQSVIGK